MFWNLQTKWPVKGRYVTLTYSRSRQQSLWEKEENDMKQNNLNKEG